ncbi:P-loop NTPase family protein [Cuniculiplasma divulgatum]|uniref:Predicted DEAD/DEAH box helicase n=1 Tax=Cuniculiplasma divulgatum TaxID=1673428 RepID=A0A1R4A6Z6_9ARCH|nr:hypothetical protein [Cuniculiplasma divulgatum]SJK84743.1 predicted DEAD/DEAH box helicase [Cuniculiplasma divulgatum]
MKSNKRPVVKAGIGKIAVAGLLWTCIVFFVSGFFLGIEIASILFVPEWVGFTLILRHFNYVPDRKLNNEICKVGFAKLIWHEDASGKGWQKDRQGIYWIPVDINEYLETKGHNRIIAVMGSSRSGKSQLVYKLIQSMSEKKKIIFMFKATDDYTRLGYPTLYIQKAVPDVFVSPEAVARAFLTAFPISTSMQGITASTVRGQVKQIAEKSKNWQDFKAILDDMLKNEKENITKGALKFIQNNLPIIYRENILNYELPDSCVVDFEGSEQTEVDMQFFTFYAEFLLNQLSKEVWNKRQDTLFVIDEAHLLTKSGFSVIPEMSALIGAKGSMILASQRIADLQGQALDNCKTQFTFKQSGKENLDEVKAMSDLFHEVVGQMLSTYEFCDIGQDRPDKMIYLFKLHNPKPNLYPVKEITLNNKDSQSEGTSEKVDKIDYPNVIIGMLSQAGNIQDLAKRFVERYGGKQDDYKLILYKKHLPMLLKLEKIDVKDVDFVKFKEGKADAKETRVYFRKNENPSGLHTYLVNGTADVIYHKGITNFKIMPSGIGTADIETDSYTLEIETGLKNDISDIKDRIDFYKTLGKETIIIVPNQDEKKKYVEKYPKVRVLTLPEIWEVSL